MYNLENRKHQSSIMAEGEKAAESIRSAFHRAGVSETHSALNLPFTLLTALQEVPESLRTNINSFADNLLGGNKQHDGTGIHPDAKKTGDGIVEGVHTVADKAEKAFHRHKKL